MTRSALVDVLVGGTQVLAVAVTAPLGRVRYNRWGATNAEVRAAMPGDDLVASPRLGYTRALSIAAPVERVWPWLVQMGQGRGGLYSFDALENLVGCDIHSVDRIMPEFQALDAGDLIRMGPAGYPCFRVRLIEAPRHLVLVGADPEPPHLEATADAPAGIATWQFRLQPIAEGTATRLVVRQRLACPRSSSVMWHLVEPVGFVMERQMLLGIRERSQGGRR